MTISLKEALTGFQLTLPHLDDHVVEIDTEGSVVDYGEVRTYRGEGMPIHGTPSEYGDLHVEFKVKFPNRFNAQEIEQLKKILP